MPHIQTKHIIAGALATIIAASAVTGTVAWKAGYRAASPDVAYAVPDVNGDGEPDLAIRTNRLHTDVLHSTPKGFYVQPEQAAREKQAEDAKDAKVHGACRLRLGR